ncbi:MAG: hypothetical protein PHQ27_10450 [Victivallales bacterium]|nr:hypothetical protein [Victivallales bacterium]
MNDYLTFLTSGIFPCGTLLLLPAAAGLGRLLYSPPATEEKNGSGRGFLLRFVLGLNLFYLISLILGVSGLMTGPLPGLLLFGTAAVELWHWLPWWRRNGNPPGAPPRHVIFWLLFIPAALFLAAPAITFPLGWDAHTYHLALPCRWHRDGFPAIYGDLPYSGFPGAAELLYWLLFRIDGIRGPGLLGWTAVMVTTFWLYDRIRSQAGTGTGLAAAVAFLAAPVTMMLLRETYVEPLLALNVLAAVELNAAATATTGNRRHYPLALGVLIGGAAALKLNGLLCGFAIVMWSGPQLISRRRQTAVAAATAMAVMLPFYLRPWLATGNPLFPFFATWFSSATALRYCSQYHYAMATAKFGVTGSGGLLAAPLLLAWAGNIFDGSYGWQLLLFLAGAFAIAGRKIVRHRPPAAFLAEAVLLLFYLGWFVTAQQARFLFPAFVLLILHVGKAGRRLTPRRRAWAALICGLLSLPQLPPPLEHSWKCWQYLGSKQIGLKDFIYTGTGPGYLTAADTMARITPPDAKILLLFDHRTLLYPRRVELGTPFFQPQLLTPPPPDASTLQRELATNGFTHLLLGLSPYHPDRLAQYAAAEQTVAEEIAQLAQSGRLQPIWQDEGFVLFRIVPSVPDRRSSCRHAVSNDRPERKFYLRMGDR